LSLLTITKPYIFSKFLSFAILIRESISLKPTPKPRHWSPTKTASGFKTYQFSPDFGTYNVKAKQISFKAIFP
jgi:hypothetical protein